VYSRDRHTDQFSGSDGSRDKSDWVVLVGQVDPALTSRRLLVVDFRADGPVGGVGAGDQRTDQGITRVAALDGQPLLGLSVDREQGCQTRVHG
jgi:hypothetical protein